MRRRTRNATAGVRNTHPTPRFSDGLPYLRGNRGGGRLRPKDRWRYSQRV